MVLCVLHCSGRYLSLPFTNNARRWTEVHQVLGDNSFSAYWSDATTENSSNNEKKRKTYRMFCWIEPKFLFTHGSAQNTTRLESLYIYSPWYNRTGWLGVKHKLTYLLYIFFLQNLYLECSVVLFHLLVSQLGSEEQEQPTKNCLYRLQDNCSASERPGSCLWTADLTESPL